jgi:hypothetical protein
MLRPDKYILKDKVPVPAFDLWEWATFMESPSNMIVEKTMIEEIMVSTVFLGLDHNYWGGPPILFETMIFGGKHDQYQRRYCTYDEAEAGHKVACGKVLDSITKEICNN